MTATGAEAGSDLAPVDPAASADSHGAEVSVPSAVPARRRLLRAAIAVVLAVLAAAAAWFLLRHGIRTDDFPPFIDGQQSTPITRYSGPWLTAAAGMALLAALLLLFAVIDLVLWSRAKRDPG